MKILVFGDGQVGDALGQYPNISCVRRQRADLSQVGDCQSVIDSTSAEAIINAAAYTSVDQAQTEYELALRVNGQAPGEMACAAARRGIPFIHLSTDYVFDGSGDQPWRPDDQPRPINAYGISKLKGEQAVQQAGGHFVVLRVSWVFSSTRNNFVKTMLRLGRVRASLKIVSDQIGGPTAAADVAQACVRIAEALKRDDVPGGIYHFSGSPDCSWADFARQIFRQADLDCEVNEISSSEYPQAARRPLNSRLDCTSTLMRLGIARPEWKTGLGEVIQSVQQDFAHHKK